MKVHVLCALYFASIFGAVWLATFRPDVVALALSAESIAVLLGAALGTLIGGVIPLALGMDRSPYDR